MTEPRDELIERMLADARRLVADKPQGTWPPKFFGMIENGPTNGSSPEYIDSVLAQGFGSER